MNVDFSTGEDTFLDISPRVQWRPTDKPDDTMKFRVHYGKADTGICVLLNSYQVRALCDYLDMEHVPPFTAISLTEETSLKVIQEPDGRTWIRAYWTDTGRGKLTFLNNEETGRLYEWLTLALDGEWKGWNVET